MGPPPPRGCSGKQMSVFFEDFGSKYGVEGANLLDIFVPIPEEEKELERTILLENAKVVSRSFHVSDS